MTGLQGAGVGGDIVRRPLVVSIFFFLVIAFPLTYGQEADTSVFLPNQEVRVADVPKLTAKSQSVSAVLSTALETIFRDKTLCCGKESALEDDVDYATQSDAVSLKELADKLRGRHRLSDGRPIAVKAEYVPQGSIYANLIIRTLLDQHAQLMQWKSHLYVLYGALFDETRHYSGAQEYAVHKLFLLDPRFSDERREVVFDRETDDWGEVQGLLTVSIAHE